MRRAGQLLAIACLFLGGLAAAQAPSGFGSQVLSGSDLSLQVRDAGTPAICRVDYGDPGSFADDGFYLDWDADGRIETNDLRLSRAQGHDAGTLVGDGDAAERLVATDCDTTPTFGYADADSNSRYGQGDPVYVASGAAFDIVTSNDLTTPDSWTLRLTPYSSLAAGALVFGGDADHTAFRDNNVALAAAEFTYHDADASANPSAADRYWLAPSAVATGSLVPSLSVRLSGAATPAPTPTSASPSPTSASPGPTDDAAAAPDMEIEVAFTRIDRVTFIASITFPDEDSAAVRAAADVNQDGTVSEGEAALGEEQLAAAFAPDDDEPPEITLDGRDLSSFTDQPVRLAHLAGPVTSTLPLVVTLVGQGQFPATADQDSYTVVLAQSEDAQSGEGSIPVELTAPPGYEIRTVDPLDDPVYGDGRSSVRGLYDGSKDLTAEFVRSQPAAVAADAKGGGSSVWSGVGLSVMMGGLVGIATMAVAFAAVWIRRPGLRPSFLAHKTLAIAAAGLFLGVALAGAAVYALNRSSDAGGALAAAGESGPDGSLNMTLRGETVRFEFVDETTGDPIPGIRSVVGIDPETESLAVLIAFDEAGRYPPYMTVFQGASEAAPQQAGMLAARGFAPAAPAAIVGVAAAQGASGPPPGVVVPMWSQGELFVLRAQQFLQRTDYEVVSRVLKPMPAPASPLLLGPALALHLAAAIGLAAKAGADTWARDFFLDSPNQDRMTGAEALDDMRRAHGASALGAGLVVAAAVFAGALSAPAAAGVALGALYMGASFLLDSSAVMNCGDRGSNDVIKVTKLVFLSVYICPHEAPGEATRDLIFPKCKETPGSTDPCRKPTTELEWAKRGAIGEAGLCTSAVFAEKGCPVGRGEIDLRLKAPDTKPERVTVTVAPPPSPDATPPKQEIEFDPAPLVRPTIRLYADQPTVSLKTGTIVGFRVVAEYPNGTAFACQPAYFGHNPFSQEVIASVNERLGLVEIGPGHGAAKVTATCGGFASAPYLVSSVGEDEETDRTFVPSSKPPRTPCPGDAFAGTRWGGTFQIYNRKSEPVKYTSSFEYTFGQPVDYGVGCFVPIVDGSVGDTGRKWVIDANAVDPPAESGLTCDATTCDNFVLIFGLPNGPPVESIGSTALRMDAPFIDYFAEDTSGITTTAIDGGAGAGSYGGGCCWAGEFSSTRR